MLYALYSNRDDIGKAFSGANWFWLGVALLLNLLASLVYVGVWFGVARLLGSQRGYDAALMSLSIAGAARYIPGGIWPVAGLIAFGPAAGLPRRVMPILVLLSHAVHLLVAGLFGVCGLLAALPVLTGGGFAATPAYFMGVGLLGVLGLATLIIGPRYLNPLLAWVLRLRFLRTSEATENEYKIQLPIGALIRPALPSALFWLLNGLRLWVTILAFVPLAPDWLPYLVWTGALSTLVTGLFFFIPLGLGVVEGSLALLLGAILPWPIVLGVIAANRLTRTLNDFIFLGVGLWLYRNLTRNSVISNRSL